MKPLEITVRGKHLRNIENFSVQEDATPLDISSSFGGVGQITFDALEEDDSRRIVGNLTLVDGSRGKTSGSVKTISGNNGKLSVVADSILGLFNVDRTVPPYQGTLSGAINFYCDLVDIPNGVTVNSDIATRPVVYPGWKGNVWVGIKQILAKEQVEMALVFDRIYVRPLRELTAHLDRMTTESFNISGTTAARSVDVYFYNNVYGTQKEVYPVSLDDATIFQVDAGETITFQEKLNASLFSVNQPVAQDWVDDERYEGTAGVYAVVGNDGLPITAAQWVDQGGSVEVSVTDDPSIIEVTVRGASMPDYAPYRIAMSSGSGNYYNSLHITGEAVVSTEEVINIKTGVTDTVSSDEVGVIVRNPFVSTREEAYSLGMIVAGSYAGLEYTISGSALDLNRGEGSEDVIQATIADFNIAVDAGTLISAFNTEWSGQDISDFNTYWQEQVDLLFDNQLFGNAIGARILTDKINYRIISATTKPDTIDFTASADTLVSDFSARWPSNESSRTNLQLDPQPVTTSSYNYSVGTGGVTSVALFSGETIPEIEQPVSYVRRTYTTGTTGGAAGFYDYYSAPAPITVGSTWTVSVYARFSTPVQARLIASARTSGVQQGAQKIGDYVSVPANTWTRITSGPFVATAVAEHVGWWLNVPTTFAVGDWMDITAILVESGSDLNAYYDGNTADTETVVYSWNGAPGASSSSYEYAANRISSFNEEFTGYTCKDFSIEPLRRDNAV